MPLQMRTSTRRLSSPMNRPARVLAAVDFSDSARAAFDHALALSRTHIAELTVVHAMPKEERFGRYARHGSP